MDMENAYDRADGKNLWKMLRMYVVDGKLLRAVGSMYGDAKASVRVGDDLSEFFNLTVEEGCVMTLWLFIVYLDGAMKENQGRILDAGMPLMREERVWRVSVLLFADDTVLINK